MKSRAGISRFGRARDGSPNGVANSAQYQGAPWFCRLETLDFDSVSWGKGGDWITEVLSGQDTTAKAATPALALCAAALKARSQLGGEAK